MTAKLATGLNHHLANRLSIKPIHYEVQKVGYYEKAAIAKPLPSSKISDKLKKSVSRLSEVVNGSLKQCYLL